MSPLRVLLVLAVAISCVAPVLAATAQITAYSGGCVNEVLQPTLDELRSEQDKDITFTLNTPCASLATASVRVTNPSTSSTQCFDLTGTATAASFTMRLVSAAAGTCGSLPVTMSCTNSCAGPSGPGENTVVWFTNTKPVMIVPYLYTLAENGGCSARYFDCNADTNCAAGDTGVSCNDNKQCTHDTYNCPTGCSGACSCGHPAAGACDDGDACTTERCANTFCMVMSRVTCTALDQCHDAGTCNPATGVCSNPRKTDGTPCDDASACTSGDSCQSGVCTGTSKVCTASDQCHDAGACNPSTGVCSNPVKADGAACNDGDACTQTDTCTAGTCTGSNPVVCTASDQCHNAGTCDHATGACSNPAKTNGASCNDGNACTLGESCQAGDCTPISNVVCTASDQCHDAGVCDPSTGECSDPFSNYGKLCDDGNACTLDDVCSRGSCLPKSNVTCTALDQCHDVGVCDPASGVCSHPDKADSSVCDDANKCTGSDVCTSGLCGGTTIPCETSDPCKIASCTPDGGCQITNKDDGTDCDDGNACTQSDSCQAGTCTGSNPVVCTAAPICHQAGVCNPATGGCSFATVDDDTACDDGDACTQTDTCQTGTCTGSNPVVCTASDQCHNAGTCNPATGTCSDPAKPNGSICNDGDACTQTDTCQTGTCTGGNPVVCTASDQCHDVGTCNAATGTCSDPAMPDETICNDGNACTLGDACFSGICNGGGHVIVELTCSPSNQCYTASCDPVTGCQDHYLGDGATCDDGDACTQTDTCTAGTCTGSNPVVCTAAPACHADGVCNTSTGTCAFDPLLDDTACDDGDACTQTDTCQAGTCTGSNPVVCTASDQCHNAGTCDHATGTCSDPAKSNGSICDDGDACTQTDTCQAGTCTGGNPVVCTASDQCHNAGTCDAGTGTCSDPVKDDGTICNDGDACTQTDTCQTGTCTGSNPVVCTASDQCHVAGTCDHATGVCSNPQQPNGHDCNDGNLCTQLDECQAGSCTGTSPVVCPTPDQCHEAGSCNPATGLCSNPASIDGKACDDGDACTQHDFCTAGACTGDDPVVCRALDQCHVVGVCDKFSGVCSTPDADDGTTCDDGLRCTTGDACQSGVCGGTNVVCTAATVCYSPGLCDESTGACSTPFNDGATCDDSNACTLIDTCQAGTCTGSNPVVCTASDQCHDAGTCDTATGVCSNPAKTDNTACNDGNACTQSDACLAGTCTGSNPVVCTASDQCHVAGECQPSTGLCSDPFVDDGTGCNDGDACTQTDICASGFCLGKNPVVCTASDQCHVAGLCNPATGACTNPNADDGTLCNDDNACTIGDACFGGVCNGGSHSTPLECEFRQCSETACDPASGCVYNPLTGTSCSDGNACTIDDTCSAGVCQAGAPKACATPDQCQKTGVCNPSNGACTYDNREDGFDCDDGSLCTTGDQCLSGFCKGTGVVCTASDQCHVAGTCDLMTGLCSNPNAADDIACNDSNACTTLDRCQAGSCIGEAPVVCTASDQCHSVGTCDTATGLCSNPVKPDNTSCSDGNACTVGDACVTGACVAGTTTACPAIDQCHDEGFCNPATGDCINPAKSNGVECSDGLSCTVGDTCMNGVCTPGPNVVCQAMDCYAPGVCLEPSGLCNHGAYVPGCDTTHCSFPTDCDTCVNCAAVIGASCSGGSCNAVSDLRCVVLNPATI